MKKNKTILLFVIVLSLFLITGCQSSNEKQESNLSVINCTRKGTLEDADSSVSLKYKVYYKDDYVQIINSVEEVKSSNGSVLDKYEKAYNNIFINYEGLDYYDNNITRTKDTVKSETTINYSKIDTNKLLEIEGSDDNVIENGKVKVDTWIAFAKKYGATCDN